MIPGTSVPSYGATSDTIGTAPAIAYSRLFRSERHCAHGFAVTGAKPTSRSRRNRLYTPRSFDQGRYRNGNWYIGRPDGNSPVPIRFTSTFGCSDAHSNALAIRAESPWWDAEANQPIRKIPSSGFFSSGQSAGSIWFGQ